MESLTFACEVVTPMFLAGADGKRAELRAPSLKGALRFWWRALNGHLSLPQLKSRESLIFGGTGEREGKSKVTVWLEADKINKSKDNLRVKGKNYPVNILEYLAFGTFEREYITPEQPFLINLKYSHYLAKEEGLKKEVLKSLSLLSLFGGLGARSRNGYGCFKINNMNFKEVFGTENKDLKTIFSTVLRNVNKIAGYTAFSNEARLFQTKMTFSSWDGALACLGTAYRKARESLEKQHVYKKRQYIATPIVVKGEHDPFLERRHAKPYFLSVQKDDAGKYIGTILFLPYSYFSGCRLIDPVEQINHFKKYQEVTAGFNRLLLESNYLESV